MNSAADALPLAFELITWVGLVPGVVLLVVGYVRQAFAARFEETWGVVIPSPAGTSYPWFRWMDTDRQLQSAPVPPGGDETLVPGDEVTVFVDRRSPDRARLDDPRSDGRVLRVIGWVLFSVGAAAGVAQLIALLAQ